MIKMSKKRRIQQAARIYHLIKITDSRIVADKYWKAYISNADRLSQQW